MRPEESRLGSVNPLFLMAGTAIIALAVLGALLYQLSNPRRTQRSVEGDSPGLLVYCAAGLRPAVEKVAADYEREQGVSVQLQYGGSNTLLSQLEVAKAGDVYLAADESYITLAQKKGLVRESIPLALMRPVIAVHQGNPKGIRAIDDLLRRDVKTALGNVDQAAVGKMTRRLLQASGHWEKLNERVTTSGVFKPTVPEVANDVKIGSVDAGIIWDATAAQYPEVEAIHTPELDAGAAHIEAGILESSKNPTAALRFARYLGARDKGLLHFKEHGYEPVDGDVWAEVPELTFFCGSVNRRAVAPVIEAFKEREGVRVNTIYNGCGILTGQMHTIKDQDQGKGFPDTYMACDVYYLDTVHEMFQEAVNISDTEVVIAVPKGNPKNIKSLEDLARPGIRVSVGQPEQCTIGVLTKQLLQGEGLYEKVMANVVTQTASSAMLIPTIVTGSVDATLAYATDTGAENNKVDTILTHSPRAKAIQPFSIARSSEQKYLGRRLYRAIAEARQSFETAGFHWRLSSEPTRDTGSQEQP